MSTQHARPLSRRRFLGELTLAGTTGLLGLRSRLVAAEPPPETTRLRLALTNSICAAPQYVAEELLRGAGFTEVQYKQLGDPPGVPLRMKALAAGDTDFDTTFASTLITRIEAGDPIVVLTGAHVGCLELFGTDQVRAIRDLKGKTVNVFELGGVFHLFLTISTGAPGEADWACGGQHQRGPALVPVFLLLGSREPGVRPQASGGHQASGAGLLKAADICALEPERAAQLLVDKGYVNRYEYALQTMKDIPYGRWREYDPEDTLRFYALRLHEAGMIKSSPQRIITQGTDWRFLNELKKELKG